ncbi:hypothetical protein [Butyrivibrio fibrisolvens]|uniref:hypothetical protein n=1 Tax=Butyrivibrio fibrisolvens TaxID=831 RepID=UPI0003B67626|nr:hypothetical protein [Butyrivibrio fibrisolvens]
MNIKKPIKIIGEILSIVAVMLIIRKLYLMKINILSNIYTLGILFISVCVFLCAISIFASFIPWAQMLFVTTGKCIPSWKLIIVCVKANVYKYIPGNIFQYVGKNELAIDEHLRQRDVASATIMDILIMLIVSIITAFLFLRKSFFIVLFNYTNKYMLLLLSILLCCSIIIIYRVKYVNELISKLFHHPKNLIISIIYYIIQNIYISSIYLALIAKFYNGTQPLFSLSPYIYGACIISGIIGFLTPGVPGGIGIREAIMIYITNGIIEESTIIPAVLIFRVISISSDLLSYILIRLTLLLKAQKSHTKRV